MTPLRFELPLDPQPQSRPRASLMVKTEALRGAILKGWKRRELAVVVAAVRRVCAGSIHITEGNTPARAWKESGALLLSIALRRIGYQMPEPTVPLEVWLWFYWPWPKSQQRVRSPRPLAFRVKKPDGDNVEKCVLDTASGLLWHDDNQVAVCHWTKLMAPQGSPGRVLIHIQEAGQPLWYTETDLTLYQRGPQQGATVVRCGR